MKINLSICFYFVFIANNVPAKADKVMYITQPKIRSTTTAYAPKVVDNTCHLLPEEGPCRANLTMFFFNSTGMDCEMFTWGGCMGNGNRFDTRDECYNHCVSKPNEPNVPPTFCQLNFDYGFCFGRVNRWYYDRIWKVCKQTIYSGCGGNGNNFYAKEHCNNVCLFGLPPFERDVTTDSKNRQFVVIDSEDLLKKTKKGLPIYSGQTGAPGKPGKPGKDAVGNRNVIVQDSNGSGLDGS